MNIWIKELIQRHDIYTSSLLIIKLPDCQISSTLTLPKRDTTIIRWYATQWHIDMPHSGISPIVSVRIFIYFCMNFVNRLSQKFKSLWFSNFHSIFALMRNRHNKLFSLITQPWRHLGAILWFHVIIHIFITIHYKLIKINTHELQVIGQHINISLSACASKFKNAQNHL